MFSPPLFAALCSPNLQVAARRIATYKPLIGPMGVDITQDKTRLTVSYRWPGGMTPAPAAGHHRAGVLGGPARHIARGRPHHDHRRPPPRHQPRTLQRQLPQAPGMRGWARPALNAGGPGRTVDTEQGCRQDRASAVQRSSQVTPTPASWRVASRGWPAARPGRPGAGWLGYGAAGGGFELVDLGVQLPGLFLELQHPPDAG